MNLKSFLHLTLANTKGLRRVVSWVVGYKIDSYAKTEKQRCIEDSQNLRNFEKQIFSQNGEDGIIEEIFNRIGTKEKYFVEFGVENGKECNTRYLLQEKAWSGLWIDGSAENMESAKKEFGQFPITLEQQFITAENIEGIFEDHQVPKELDLLSIDVDGNDYWILKALSEYRPRLLIVEYNASFLPHEEWVMPYDPKHIFDGTNHFGASLASLTELAKTLGFGLVACDSRGVNAFFVRKDLLNDQFTHLSGGPEYHYCAPKYKRNFFGHPPRV